LLHPLHNAEASIWFETGCVVDPRLKLGVSWVLI